MSANSPIYKTRFYSDCIGVFQGGGCRAAAFGGAYDAAFKLGVRFSEVAGTSAGSIVAALLAAGAEPAFLLAKLETLDFPSLLVKPTRSTFSTESKLVSVLQKVPLKGEVLDSILGIARLGGLHSSVGIETWVEGCLKELTGKQNGPVLFSDLVMPLHVVAGDLSTMKPRVWSSRTTANQSVAHAVRASCTIPLFFQPVEEGSALLVDGGIVSNIPHFLFTGDGAQRGKGRKRVLLFMLEASEERKRADDAKELLSQLASLAVDGGTDVQLTFTPDIARIVIPTGNIRATDFNEMDKAKMANLIANGRTAAEAFITGELLSTQGSPAESSSISDEHEAFLTVCEQLYSTRSSVRVAMPDTKWFWELFPTVLHWRKTNIRIVAFVPPIAANSPDGAKEKQRRDFMVGMGVELVETAAMAFHGLLFDTVASSGAAALTFPGERTDYEPAGRFYSGRIDQAAIAALHERLQFPNVPAANSQHKPLLQPADPAALLTRLRENVQFYREPGVTLAIEEVELSKVFLISRYVRAFRYKQIQSFVAHYQERGLELFMPAQVPLHGGGVSLVTPPVVEETNSKFVALEGNTRFLFCFNNGISKIKAANGEAVDVPALFERSFRRDLFFATIESEPSLREFFGREQNERIDRFRDVDEKIASLTRALIRARLAAGIPRDQVKDDVPKAEIGLLRREIAKKMRHIPVRQLLNRIPNLLSRLKPCVLMSPLSVAQYLEPSHVVFDVVIFDEASQIPVWDAIGAIARGQQLIVVGDPKQLPPTNFFNSAGDDEDSLAPEEFKDLESILDELMTHGLRHKRLQWHYRSRHEGLIAFSNRQYYDNELLTFPSAEIALGGVRFKHLPEARYDKGKSRTNRLEADALVAELVARLRNPDGPRRSFGVVTFSLAQQQLIENLLDEERRKFPEIEVHFGDEPPIEGEPVFVKNLENVQGDERDVIFFSICYGADETGRVAMNFGPLNRDGGERRLNVAITRAKHEVLVFSGLRADQIDLTRTRARGVRDLKYFLDYAERGPSALAAATSVSADGDPDSEFEQMVADRLRAAGYEVHHQVGCSGYRIDLGILDPTNPGRYQLGVECDGATYHRAATARDRDKLRQFILEGLGWTLYRVWSTDWWHDSEAETKKLLSFIQELSKQT